MPKLKGGSRAEHEVAPNASQIVSSRRPRNDLPIEEVRFAADFLLEEGGFEPSVPREEKAHLRCPKRNSAVPVLAKGKTDTGRCWVYVRDDRPFGGQDPPAAMFYYSRDRAGEHAQVHLADYAGIFQADAFGGYNRLYEADRKPGQIVEAACWVHARRPFFQMADLAATARRRAQGKTLAVISPLALEAVRRIDALFEIERSINGQSGVGLSGRN